MACPWLLPSLLTRLAGTCYLWPGSLELRDKPDAQTRFLTVLSGIVLLAILPMSTAAQQSAQQSAQQPDRIGPHQAAVNALVFTPEDETLATGSSDRTIKLWDVATAQEIRTLAGHEGQVLSLAISPDGQTLISGAQDNTIKLWDIPRPRPLAALVEHGASITALAQSPGGRTIVSASRDRTLKLWDLDEGRLIAELAGHAAAVLSAAYRPDGNQIASGDADGIVRLWLPADGLLRATLGAHTGGVTALGYHANNQLLFTAGVDGAIKTWQLPIPPARTLAGHDGSIRAIVLTSDNRVAITGGADKTVRAFDAASGLELRKYEGQPGAVTTLALSVNGAAVAGGDATGVIQFWNFADAADRLQLAGHDGAIRALAFHPDNQRIASAGDDGTIRLWTMPMPPVVVAGHTGPVRAVAASPNGQTLATGGDDQSIKLWNPAGQAIRQIDGHEAPPERIAFRADSAELASGDAAGMVQITSVGNGQTQGRLGAHRGPVTGLAYHPDMKFLWTAGADGLLKRWQLPLVLPRILAGHADVVTAVAVSPDAKLVVTGSTDKTVRVYDATTGQQARAFDGQPGEVSSLALSPDAAIAASGSESGVVKLWNLVDGADRLSLSGHQGPIRGISFHPDGEELATAGADGTIRRWRLPEPARKLAGHSMPVTAVAAGPRGKLLATASADKMVRLWNAADGVAFHTLEGHVEAVSTIDVRSDGAQVASGDTAGAIRFWKTAEGAEEGRVIGHTGRVTSVVYHPANKWLLSAGVDGRLKWWRLPVESSRILSTSEAAVRAAAASSDGKIVVTGDAGGGVQVLAADQPPRSLAGQPGPVTSLALGAGDSLIAAGNETGEIKLWSLDGADRWQISGHTGPVTGVAFHPDGKQIATSGADGTIRLWNLPSPPKAAGQAMPMQASAIDSAGRLLATAVTIEERPAIVIREIASGKVFATLLGHQAPIKSLAFSRDGARLISGSEDKSARVWDLQDNKFPQLARYDGHGDAVTSVALSPDGKHAFSGGNDKLVKHWNAADGTQLHSFAGHAGAITSLTSTGKGALSGSADGTARMWNLSDGTAVRSINHGAAVSAVAVSPDGKHVATAGTDAAVKLWTAADGAAIAKLNGHAGAVSDLRFSKSGQRIVSAAGDGIRLWNTAGRLLERFAQAEPPLGKVGFAPNEAALFAAASDSTLHTYDISLIRMIDGHEGEAGDLAFTPDGKSLASGGADKTVRLWNLADSALLRTFLGAGESITSVAISANAARLTAGTADHRVHVWNLAESPDATDLQPEATFSHPAPVRDVAFDLLGSRVAASGDDGVVRVWDLESGGELERMTGHTGTVSVVRFTETGNAVVSAGADKTTRRWPVSAVRAIANGDARISDLALSTDGKQMAVATGGGVVLRFDAETGQPLEPLSVSDAAIHTVSLRSDGLQLAAGGAEKKVYLWPLGAEEKAEPVVIETSADVRQIRYQPNGMRLAVGEDARLRIYDSRDGRLLEEITLPAASAGIAYGPGGDAILSASANEGLWQPLSLIGLLVGHAGAVSDVAYLTGGRQIVSGGSDKRVQLWSLDGQSLRTFEGAADEITSVAVTPDGRRVFAGSLDKQAYAWRLADEEEEKEDSDEDVGDAAAAAKTAEKTAEKTELPEFSLSHPAAVRDIALVGEGDRIATCGDDRFVRVWDLKTRRELERFAGHEAAVLAVATADDQKTLLSAGADKSARVWTAAATGVAIADPETVTDFALSGDGSLAATAGNSRGIKLWDAGGKLTGEIDAGDAHLVRVAIRPDGTHIAAAEKSGAIHIWETAAARKVYVIPGEVPIHRLAFSPDQTRLAVCDESGDVRLYDSQRGRLLQRFENAAAAHDLAFTPDSLRLVFALADNQAMSVPISIGRLILGHEGPVTSLAFTPNGAQLASGGADKTVRLWNLADGKQLRRYAGNKEPVTSVTISRDGGRVVSGGLDQVVRTWSIAPPPEEDAAAKAKGADVPPEREEAEIETLLPELNFTHSAAVRGVSISGDGTKIAAADDSGMIRVWDVASGHEWQRFAAHRKAALSVAFGADNKTLASAGADTAAHIHGLSVSRLIGAHEGRVNAIAMVGGAQVVSVGDEDVVRLWEPVGGQLVREMAGGKGPLFAVAVRPDNQQIAAGGAAGNVWIWNTNDGQLTAQITTPAAIRSLNFSPDGAKLVVGGDDKHLRVYQAAEGELRGELLQDLIADAPLPVAAFLPTGRRIITGDKEGLVRLWVYASPTAVKTFAGHGGAVYSLAFEPGGKTFVSASADQTVRIWNVETGNQLRQLAGHQGPVYSVDFGPQGGLLVSGGADKTVRLWDAAGGRQLKQILVSDASIYSVAFHPDGKRVAAAGLDKTIRIYDALTGSLINTLSGHPDYIYRVAFDRKKDRLLSCGYGGNILLWDVTSGNTEFSAHLNRVTNHAVLSEGGKRIAVAGGDGAAYLLNLPTAADPAANSSDAETGVP